jgi:hypothetical protein
VRKIISILMTLGLILGLVVIAAPTSAATVCVATDKAVVKLSNSCACLESVYNITFNTSASLTQGLNHVCVEFPEGTTLPDEFDDGDILIGVNPAGDEVFGDEVTIDGNTVCFLVPEDIPSGSEVLVQFTDGIYNTCTPGWTELYVWTDRAPDSEPVMGEFKIKPLYATYKFVYDFGATYPGIKQGFVPPFRACGQNDTLQGNTTLFPNGGYDTTYIEEFGGFVTNFTLFFKPVTSACQPPCEELDVFLEVVNIPDGEEVHLILGSDNWTLDVCNITKTEGEYDSSTDILLLDNYSLTTNQVVNWTGALHFSSPGKDYEIGLYYDCPVTCCGGGIVGGTQVFEVHQDKEAYKLLLCEKWNLVSLPLVPLVDPPTVEDYLASINMPAAGVYAGYASYMIGAIHTFDAFDAADPWKRWMPGDPTNDLLELEDGKAYWVYVAYPLAEAFYEFLVGEPGTWPGIGCCDDIVWWIWGTEKPVPPAAPSQYPVAEGWNMLGFTSVDTTMNPIDYLWNWDSTVDPVTYGYTDACWNLQTWQLIPFTTGTLVPGEGYFVAFPKAGTVYVP